MHVPMQVINITFVSIFFIYSHYETGKPFLTGATFFCPPIVYLRCEDLNNNNAIYLRYVEFIKINGLELHLTTLTLVS